MSNTDVHRHLIEGLVGDRHIDKWHHSPAFKAAVETLAGLLPAMVDGLAEAAEQQDARVQQTEQLLRQQPPLMWQPSDEALAREQADSYHDPERRLLVRRKHMRASTEQGPDYCAPCSEAIGDWVSWPCPGSRIGELRG